MNLVFVSSEVAPYSKSGGLADVVGALSDMLARAGHQVLCVSPRYGSVDPEGLEDSGTGWAFHLGSTLQPVHFWRRATASGVVHVFVQHPVFQRPGLYGDGDGSYTDNHLRFALLCRGAIEAARRVPFTEGRPLGEDVVFHCHDWQTALLPAILDACYRPVDLFTHASTVFTVHNLAHQGRFEAERFLDLDLAQRWFSPGALEFHGHMNLLKAALLLADEITTVSPSYAQEICTPAGGFGLDPVLLHRSDRITGILNGIDAELWNPETDPLLDARFSTRDLEGKAQCKAALQRELGLPVDPTRALVASVGRLDPQKGIDMAIDSLPWATRDGTQHVFLGTAAPGPHQVYEWRLREAERNWPQQVRACIGFSEALAHKIIAGADLFSMPSLFEPCGLTQMYAMRYGTVPIVRSIGGLADTVSPFNPTTGSGTGWVFTEPSGEAYRNAMHEALYTWHKHPASFESVRTAGMRQDWGWPQRLGEYEHVYARALARRRLPPGTPSQLLG